MPFGKRPKQRGHIEPLSCLAPGFCLFLECKGLASLASSLLPTHQQFHQQSPTSQESPTSMSKRIESKNTLLMIAGKAGRPLLNIGHKAARPFCMPRSVRTSKTIFNSPRLPGVRRLRRFWGEAPGLKMAVRQQLEHRRPKIRPKRSPKVKAHGKSSSIRAGRGLCSCVDLSGGCFGICGVFST